MSAGSDKDNTSNAADGVDRGCSEATKAAKQSPAAFSDGFDPDYFARHYADTPALPLAEKVCRDAEGRVDCAVLCGMYRGISNDLKKCEFDLRVTYSRSWFCHAQHGACRGNALNQGREVMRALTQPPAKAGEAKQ